MSGAVQFRVLADVVLFVHVTFVTFVVLGLVSILIGGARGWRWIRNPWLRICHLAAIAVVAVQTWLGVTCPFTRLEMVLRRRAGDATYDGSFIAHWLEELFYADAPAWLFAIAYTLFGLAVLGTWFGVPPRPLRVR